MDGENVLNQKTSCCSHCGCFKALLPAFVITIIGTVIGFLTCGWLFSWVYEIEPISAWKYIPGIVAPSTQTVAINFVGELILAIIT